MMPPRRKGVILDLDGGDRPRRVVAPIHGGMQMDVSEKGPNEISRRRMLKRIGAGTAIAWAAPVLTSLRMPAFAQATSGACVAPCPGRANCGVGADCGPATNTCHCSDTVAGPNDCFCFNNERCGDATSCTTTAECQGIFGPGWVCLSATNGCHASVCAAPCGTCPVNNASVDPDMTLAGFIA